MDGMSCLQTLDRGLKGDTYGRNVLFTNNKSRQYYLSFAP